MTHFYLSLVNLGIELGAAWRTPSFPAVFLSPGILSLDKANCFPIFWKCWYGWLAGFPVVKEGSTVKALQRTLNQDWAICLVTITGLSHQAWNPEIKALFPALFFSSLLPSPLPSLFFALPYSEHWVIVSLLRGTTYLIVTKAVIFYTAFLGHKSHLPTQSKLLSYCFSTKVVCIFQSNSVQLTY